ncbi:FG-GAP-like repeat-containing protein [Citromicrobium bathyomarinum]|uniref:FG-GAP-like repeat-containing protein n=1 Tax=Citromicrobium bathyomarinum TaxID=72174 RepID=UPI00315AC8D6
MDRLTLRPPGFAGSPGIAWRRIVLASILTLIVALYFWTQSRYPALDTKAMMGGDTPIAGISFDVIVEILPTDGWLWDVIGNTLNWAYTNWKGMTFGFMFGACALTLLSQIQRRSFRHPIANASLGAAIGAPLGVCVNCAAPIARGLHEAGLRLETTLAAMIASPTLNVIVVSMSFALLPFYMATAKLVAMLLFIVLGIPLIVRFAGKDVATQREALELTQAAIGQERRKGWFQRLETIREMDPTAPAGEGWLGALRWLAESFARNLVFIVVATLPLMLLAGTLGAIAITFLPFDRIADWIDFGGYGYKFAMIVLIAVICIFLPVPMSFDVVLATILIASGWPAILVMPLLLCLGSFSVYSYLVIGRAVSWRLSTSVMAALVMLAIATTGVAWRFDVQKRESATANNIAYLKTGLQLYDPPAAKPVGATKEQIAALKRGVQSPPAPADLLVDNSGPGTVTATLRSLGSHGSTGGGTPFTRLPGSDIGLDLAPSLSGLEVLEPYTMYWAAAAGDIDGDGWTDVALANPPSKGGIALFANVGGRFHRQILQLDQIDRHFVNAVAFVDLNNDGKSDLFVSTYFHGAWVFWNRDGFSSDAATALDNGDAPMVGAPGFADLDGDGNLDILAANWSTGTNGNNHLPFLLSSRDRIMWNDGDERFTSQLLEGLPGESLTSLITDVDGDGRPDLLIGDDVSTSDKVYLNKGSRKFTLLRKQDKLIPYLTNTTMSLDMGDVDNRGMDTLYAVQIAFEHKKEQFNPDVTYCIDDLSMEIDKTACFAIVKDRSQAYRSASAQYSDCDKMVDPRYRAMCAALSMIRRSGYKSDPTACDNLPAQWTDIRAQCLSANGQRVPNGKKLIEKAGYVGGVRGRNVLLHRSSSGGDFVDQTRSRSVAQPGWAWNSKFADLDQDGWQDIFVASGFLTHRSVLPSTYYRNSGNGNFERASKEFGFEDEIPSTSYLLLDFDRDGDMDLIRPSAISQPLVHRADGIRGGSLWVRLDDSIGNRSGVGATVRVRIGKTWLTREIRQSGGFASADRPEAHFGLGAARKVDSVEVLWRDGSKTMLKGPIPANSELTVRRAK